MRFTIDTDRASVEREHHDLAGLDRNGRRIGSRVTRFEADARPNPNGYGYELPGEHAGRVYGFTPQATRNGVSYGASQYSSIFRTREEREAAVARYLSGARRRAEKKANPAQRRVEN